jgi:hypothetical protein
MGLSLSFVAVCGSTLGPSTDANTVLRAATTLAQRTLALYVGWSEDSVPVIVVGVTKMPRI